MHPDNRKLLDKMDVADEALSVILNELDGALERAAEAEARHQAEHSKVMKGLDGSVASREILANVECADLYREKCVTEAKKVYLLTSVRVYSAKLSSYQSRAKILNTEAKIAAYDMGGSA